MRINLIEEVPQKISEDQVTQKKKTLNKYIARYFLTKTEYPLLECIHESNYLKITVSEVVRINITLIKVLK